LQYWAMFYLFGQNNHKSGAQSQYTKCPWEDRSMDSACLLV
jgi:hypothetical protein